MKMNSKKIVAASQKLLLVSLASAMLTACGNDPDGTAVQEVSLPVDKTLTLYCPEVGINTDKCILDDPENPYARSNVNNITKWDLSDNSPSAKSRFYVWATALAKDPIGENQYYTAAALHALYTEGGSQNAQSQAKKAYQSVLDNFYNSLTFYTANKPLDLLADVDFYFGEWGSGSALNGDYRDDEDIQPVFRSIAGGGWGAPSAVLAFTGMEEGIITNYENLEFKIKGLPTSAVYVKFAWGANTGTEVMFDLATYSTDIDGTTDWKQVSIPLSSFPDANLYTEFGIHGGYSNGGQFLITDILFSGDATGNGLYKDLDSDGAVYLYKSNPGTEQKSLNLRDLVGERMYAPREIGLLQLYYDSDDAMTALDEWGYRFDPATRSTAKTED